VTFPTSRSVKGAEKRELRARVHALERIARAPVSHLRLLQAWGNNVRRRELKGRRYLVLAHGRTGFVLREFENGERVVSSYRSVTNRSREGPERSG
jgi:hypothetical protein